MWLLILSAAALVLLVCGLLLVGWAVLDFLRFARRLIDQMEAFAAGVARAAGDDARK